MTLTFKYLETNALLNFTFKVLRGPDYDFDDAPYSALAYQGDFTFTVDIY